MTSKPETARMAGREPALAAVRTAFDVAAGGRGRLVLVVGEPGIGKTTLLGAMAAEAVANTGALVLWGQCWDGDGAPAYWPWVQVLRAGLAAGGEPGDAAMVLPEEASLEAVSAGGSPNARFRLFDAMAGFLIGLAAHRAVVVVLDDLQWADEGSLRLLEFASRHVARHGVLLIGAYRDEEAGDELRQLATTIEQVALAGLSRGDVAALMTALADIVPPGAVVDDVWRRTGGNPFLVRELTRLLVAQGDFTTGAAPSGGLLDTVRDILGRRLARLSQPCADLLTLAAVCGPAVRVELLLQVTADLGDVPRLLDEAVAARVLVEPAQPADPYRFSHDLFRETIVAGLPADARARLHLDVGRALEARQDQGAPVHPAELAAHFTAAVDTAPAEAARYSRLAAEDATARLAFEEACAQYERALAALGFDPEPDPALRLELLLRLGEARNRAGRVRAAVGAYREAASLARRLDDSTSLARAAIGVHDLGWRQSHASSIDLLDEAAHGLPETASATRARVLASLARDLHHSVREQNWERAPLLAEEAVGIAREVADPDTLGFCLLALHDVRWRPGTAGSRLPVIDEMLAAADAARDREIEAQARLLRATALIELGDPRGIAELDSYCRICDELGHARARYGALSRRATAALLAGRLADAQDLAEQAFALGENIGEADVEGVHETLLWAVLRVGGSGHTRRTPSLDSDPWPGLPIADAVLRLALGDLDAARRLLAGLDVDDLPRRYDLEMLAFLAETVAAAGSPDQQGRLYEMLRPYAGTHVVVGGCASYLGAADHYLGLLARALGHLQNARQHFEDAAALHDRLGAIAWRALSRAEAEACEPAPTETDAVFRRDGQVWTINYGGNEAHLPDAKGLRDLAALLARPGQSVHAVELHTGRPPQTGADSVLDESAKAAYRRRLTELESDIDEAEANHDLHRAEKAHAERDALITELSAAVGLGGRDRRLGDDSERARKAVSARIRDAIDRIEHANPQLAQHLSSSVQTGTWCTYAPGEPTRWDL